MSYPRNIITLAPLPLGQAQTDETIRAMFKVAKSAQTTGGVTTIADLIKRDSRDRIDSARRLFAWFKDRTKFVEDPADVEALWHPDFALDVLAHTPPGHKAPFDCKKLSTLAVAILTALGSAPRLITLRREGAPDWHHVLAGVQFSRWGSVLPFDPQDSAAPFEWPQRGPIAAATIYLGENA